MRYLIDTHIFIWVFSEPERIKPDVKIILEDSEIELFISPISLYEIQQKRLLGKLDFDVDLNTILEEDFFKILKIDTTHAIATINLPLIHRDPFDRILIAQSIVEKMPLITADIEIKKYNFKYIDA